MRATKKRSLQVEPLESRELLSSLSMAMLRHARIASAHVRHKAAITTAIAAQSLPLSLEGSVAGRYIPTLTAFVSPLNATTVLFGGSGTVSPIGANTTVAGTLMLPGSGQTSPFVGMFTFTQAGSNGANSVTIGLLASPAPSPPLPAHVSDLPPGPTSFQFQFMIVSGTGTFSEATGNGAATLTLTPNPAPVGPFPTSLIARLPGGTFSMSLGPITPFA